MYTREHCTLNSLRRPRMWFVSNWFRTVAALIIILNALLPPPQIHSHLSTCFFVCLLAGRLRNYGANFHEIWFTYGPQNIRLHSASDSDHNLDSKFYCIYAYSSSHPHTHTHPFNSPFSGTTRVSRYQKGKPIGILLKQEAVSGSGISWTICKSAPRSRQITMPAPHHSVFYRPDALLAAQPTVSKHWRQLFQ